MNLISKPFQVASEENLLYRTVKLFVIGNLQNKIFQLIMFILEELQYISILLWSQCKFFTYSDTNLGSIFICKASQAISFRDLKLKPNDKVFEAVLIIIWIYIILVTAMFGHLVTYAYRRRENKVPNLRRTIYSGIFQLHFKIFFWIANMIIMAAIPRWNQSPISIFGSINQNGVFMTIQVVALTLNYTFGFITAIFCFDPFCSKNITASQTPSYQFLTFLFKATMALLAVFGNRNNPYAQTAITMTTIIMSLGRLYLLKQKSVFYYYSSTSIAIVASSIASWISLMNILAAIFHKDGIISSFSLFYLTLVPLPIIVKLSLISLQRDIRSYILIDPLSIKNQESAFRKLFGYCFLPGMIRISLNEELTLSPYEIYFMSDLARHSRSCQDDDCICRLLIVDKDEEKTLRLCSVKASLAKYFQLMKRTCLTRAVESTKENIELNLALAYEIYNGSEAKIGAAIMSILAISYDKSSFLQRIKRSILVGKLQERTKHYFETNQDGILNLAAFIDCEQSTTGFISQMYLTTEKYLTFWRLYLRHQIKWDDIIRQSEEIEAGAKIVDQQWGKFVEKYENFYHGMKRYYTLFLCLVRNIPFTSRKILKKNRWKRNNINSRTTFFTEINNNDLISSKAFTLYVSMSREKFGKLLYASKNAQSLLEYENKDIVGKSINSFMTSSLAEKHNEIMLKHVDQSKLSQAQDHLKIKGFLKKRSGLIVPCTIQISVFPYIQSELVYVTFIKTFEARKVDYMVIDRMGYIESFTMRLVEILNLKPNTKRHIRDVCMNIEGVLFKSDTRRSTRASFVRPSISPQRTVQITEQGLASQHGSNCSSIIQKLGPMNTANSFEKDVKDDVFQEIVTLKYKRQGIDSRIFIYSTKITKRQILDTFIYILEIKTTSDLMTQTEALEPEIYNETREDRARLDTLDGSATTKVFSSLNHQLYKQHEKSSIKIPSGTPLLKSSYRLAFDSAKNESHCEMLSPKTNKSNEDTPRARRPKKLFDFSTIITQDNNKPTIENNPDVNAQSESLEQDIQSNDEVSNPSVHSHRALNQIDTQSNVSSTASGGNHYYSKLEKVVYSLPPKRFLRFQRVISWTFVLICVIFSIVLFIQVQENFTLVKKNTLLITWSTVRNFDLVRMNRALRLITMFDQGLLSPSRYSVLGSNGDGKLLTLNNLIVIQNDLADFNNKVRIVLDEIEASVNTQIYRSQIPLVVFQNNKDSTPNMNTFDLATYTIVKAKKIIETPPALVTQNNDDLNFILNNTINTQLGVSEKITSVVEVDNNLKFTLLSNHSDYFIVGSSLVGILVLLVSLYQQTKINQERNKVVELFLRINEGKIEEIIKEVRVFRNGLIYSKSDREFQSFFNNRFNVKEEKHIYELKAQNKTISTFKSMQKGLLAQVFTLIVIVITLCPNILFGELVKSKSEAIKQEVASIIEINYYLLDLSITYTTIYEYINLNGTTQIKGRPIGIEWEDSYTRLSDKQSLFLPLLDGFQRSGNQEAVELLDGNLCKAMNIPTSLCKVLKGMLDKGIMQLNSYMMSTLRTIKDSFDVSDMSVASKIKILGINDLILIESLAGIVILSSYAKLGQILQKQVENGILTAQKDLRIPFAISIVLYVAIGCIVFRYIWRKMRDEKARDMKIFRKIPFPVIVSNLMLKNHFNKEMRVLK